MRDKIKKGVEMYYARQSTYDLCECKVRGVYDNWFVVVDKRDKVAYLLSYNSVNKTIFFKRGEALNTLLKMEEIRDKEVENE